MHRHSAVLIATVVAGFLGCGSPATRLDGSPCSNENQQQCDNNKAYTCSPAGNGGLTWVQQADCSASPTTDCGCQMLHGTDATCVFGPPDNLAACQ